MFETTLAGSLPKPSWLATPNVLWAPWTLTGAPLQEAKEDAPRPEIGAWVPPAERKDDVVPAVAPVQAPRRTKLTQAEGADKVFDLPQPMNDNEVVVRPVSKPLLPERPKLEQAPTVKPEPKVEPTPAPDEPVIPGRRRGMRM